MVQTPEEVTLFFFGGRTKDQVLNDAWSKLAGMSRDDAMDNYIRQVDKLNRD